MIDKSTEDYISGYKDGFAEGWDAAKKSMEIKLKKENDFVSYPPVYDIRPEYNFEQGCVVCGIGKNGEPLGYPCQHPLCPTRITS